MRAETSHVRDKNHAWQPTSSIKFLKKSWWNWMKALVIIGLLSSIVLLIAVIVVPIYIGQLIASGITTTTAATTTIYLPPQCSNYTLNTDATRLTSYSAVQSGCDSSYPSTGTWVHFGGSASQMASSAPSYNRCGTNAPGWFTGALPSTVGSSVAGVVCFVGTSTICDAQRFIFTTNCNGFYVYLLLSTGCNWRYCTQ